MIWNLACIADDEHSHLIRFKNKKDDEFNIIDYKDWQCWRESYAFIKYCNDFDDSLLIV